jgi:hypothetical protein
MQKPFLSFLPDEKNPQTPQWVGISSIKCPFIVMLIYLLP